MTSRVCSKCKIGKPATREHFHKNNRAKDWCAAWCRECTSAFRHPNKKTTSELFWSRVSLGAIDACWEWTGSRHYRGYGRFGKHRALHETFAHRYAYADQHGEIPDGIEVRHKCDNPPCCNPNHLELGTHLQNMQDMVERRRLPDRRGERSYFAKLTERDVVEIRVRLSLGQTHASIAADYGIKPVTVTAINGRRTWKHVA